MKYFLLIMMSITIILNADTNRKAFIGVEKSLKKESEENWGNSDITNSNTRRNLTPKIYKDNDIQIDKGEDKDKVKKENIDTPTKGQEDYFYLHGYNLSNASYQYATDYYTYYYYLHNNQYIPQGLAKDKDNNLLIAMYHKDVDGDSYMPSIVVKYNTNLSKIMKIYTPVELTNNHVGGIGYYYDDLYDKDYIFISNGSYFNLYEIDSIGTQSESLYYLKKYYLGFATSTMSVSNGYLWIANYACDHIDYNDDCYTTDKLLTGFKIGNLVSGTIYLSLKYYRLTQPKYFIQGIYADAYPDDEKRLKFYFSASSNTTYVYQAVLETKDIDGNGIISGDDEYYWESFYTPYGHNAGTYRKLPDGGEGLVIKDSTLFMLNEGATEHYCSKTLWWEEDIDCAREILEINPVYKQGISRSVFPSASIEIKGTGIGYYGDYGHKVAIVYFQNKKGELYYSIGEFDCGNSSTSCKMYLKEPSSRNPTGLQIDFLDYWFPKGFVEDIVGINIMNLDEDLGDSDDFTLTEIIFGFDDNINLGNDDPAGKAISVNWPFGDSSGDYTSMEYYFQFKHNMGTGSVGSDSPGWDSGLLYNNINYGNTLNELNSCYQTFDPIDRSICRLHALQSMQEYLVSSSWWFLYYRINKYISRLYNITL